MNFELYSTDGCHLCEQVVAMLEQLNGLDLVNMVDIVDSDALTELYGIRIPVVKNLATNQELGWPFEIEQLAAFIGFDGHK